ncbi:MAG TPA: hypothetical protein VFV14_11450 [Myxococcaceae bacterium]|nr:hypothetical protein [Myxococcaceae bacterium]
MPAALLAALISDAGPLGIELRQDGYSLRPPSDFTKAYPSLFQGTRALAPTGSPSSSGTLSAFLVDRTGQDAASMVVSVVDGSLAAAPAARDEFSTAVVRHFSDELGLALAMDRAELVSESAPRVEVLATLRQGDQLRNVLVAGMAGKGRHAVISFSVPSGRWGELRPQIRASLDSFRNEPSSKEIPRTVAGAAAGALLGTLVASVALWRRRQRKAR